ncbi:MAG: hypothetical protein ACYC4I_00115 [Minisyncoccota bacterium]
MYTFSKSVGSTHVEIRVLSPRYAETIGLKSWSLRGLQTPEDVTSNMPLVRALRKSLLEFGVTRAFAPHVAAASGKIVNPAKLTTDIPFWEVVVQRNQGLPADGVFLKPEGAFMMSGAGCPIILASAGKHLIVAHAGRDSLIDRGAVMGKQSRRRLSIVDEIVCTFGRNGRSPKEIAMVMMFAIPAGNFEHRENHPVYGEYNRALVTFAERWRGAILWRNGHPHLNLERVFLEQARQAGVRRAQAICQLDDFSGLAHTRDGKDSNRRNLIIVKRIS